MAPGSTVQTAAAGRTCPDCKQPIDSSRRYCDRDRDRRRAMTFLEQALRVVERAPNQTPFFPATRHRIYMAIGERDGEARE